MPTYLQEDGGDIRLDTISHQLIVKAQALRGVSHRLGAGSRRVEAMITFKLIIAIHDVSQKVGENA
jgi:hypothetical protein